MVWGRLPRGYCRVPCQGAARPGKLEAGTLRHPAHATNDNEDDPHAMNTRIYTHEACFDHRPGPHHPESPERLRAVLDALKTPEFAQAD